MDLNTQWFMLLGILLSGYAILDGFDLGVGILHFIARGDRERRVMMKEKAVHVMNKVVTPPLELGLSRAAECSAHLRGKELFQVGLGFTKILRRCVAVHRVPPRLPLSPRLPRRVRQAR